MLQAEQQRYYAGRKVLEHQALLSLLFPGVEKERQPLHTFLATGSQGLQVAFQQLARSIAAAQKHGRAFENTFQPSPGQWGVQRQSDQWQGSYRAFYVAAEPLPALSAYHRASHSAARYGALARQGSYREVLIKAMNAAHVWRVAVSPWEHALLTSKPDERDRITQLMAAKGDAVRGIRAWVKETYG